MKLNHHLVKYMWLEDFSFTNNADKAASKTTGWILYFTAIDTFSGNDTITGYSNRSDGIKLDAGTINTGDGDNIITGNGKYNGIGLYGFGNDRSSINTGNGNDAISGTARDRSSGAGINLVRSSINTGNGNDTITGNGSYGIDIYNNSSINTGSGNDTITGNGREYGIFVDKNSTINTGDGNDNVDALEGGFGGIGKTYLGAGKDTLRGFGEGNFYGGTGKDKIFFDAGKYRISGSSVKHDGETMKVYEFEKIGGVNGGLFGFKDGTLTVDSKGVGTFA